MSGFPNHFVFLCGAHMDQVMRLYSPAVAGSSNPAEVAFSPGGAALNSASIAAAMELNCRLVSPVGRDVFADQLRYALAQRCVEDGLISGNGDTGIYAALFNPDGDLAIGAAGLSIYDRINEKWIEDALVPLQRAETGIFINANLSSQLLMQAISGFNTIAAATISPGKAPRLLPILAEIDILFTNRREAGALLGVTETESMDALAATLREHGVSSGTISDGSNPLYFWQGERSGIITPGSPDTIADVNGAGDALAGATLALLANGRTFEDAVKGAMKIATETLKHSGPYPQDAGRLFKNILQD